MADVASPDAHAINMRDITTAESRPINDGPINEETGGNHNSHGGNNGHGGNRNSNSDRNSNAGQTANGGTNERTGNERTGNGRTGNERRDRLVNNFGFDAATAAIIVGGNEGEGNQNAGSGNTTNGDDEILADGGDEGTTNGTTNGTAGRRRSRRSGLASRLRRCFGFRPAEKTCCGCVDIDKSAQTVGMYLTMQGFLAMFSLFSLPKVDPHLSELSYTLMWIQAGFRVLSLVYGMKVLHGCAWRQPRPLQECYVFLIVYLAFVVLQLLRLTVVCEEMKDVANVSCDQVKMALLFYITIEYSVYAYMAYILWSYSVKLQRMPNLSEELLPHELLPRFADYVQREANEAQQESQRPRTMPTGQTAHRLQTFQESEGPVQPFSGEGFRLEPE